MNEKHINLPVARHSNLNGAGEYVFQWQYCVYKVQLGLACSTAKRCLLYLKLGKKQREDRSVCQLRLPESNHATNPGGHLPLPSVPLSMMKTVFSEGFGKVLYVCLYWKQLSNPQHISCYIICVLVQGLVNTKMHDSLFTFEVDVLICLWQFA